MTSNSLIVKILFYILDNWRKRAISQYTRLQLSILTKAFLMYFIATGFFCGHAFGYALTTYPKLPSPYILSIL